MLLVCAERLELSTLQLPPSAAHAGRGPVLARHSTLPTCHRTDTAHTAAMHLMCAQRLDLCAGLAFARDTKLGQGRLAACRIAYLACFRTVLPDVRPLFGMEAQGLVLLA